MSSAYIIQLEQKISSLISEAKYKQAFELCQNTLERFPNEKSIANLKEKIEYLVEEKNSQIVEEKFDQAEKLFDEKQYAQCVRELMGILKLSPNHKKAIKLQHKAQSAYQEEITKLQTDFKNKQQARLTEILKNNPEKLSDELFTLETNNPKNPEIFALTKEFRNKLIEQKIKEKAELLSSNKYDAIQSFIDQLRRIDQKNPLITKLVQSISSHKQEEQINSTKEFVYKGENYLDTMMKLKKFDKVMQAAEEVLSIEKNNKKVKAIYEKAKGKFFKQSRRFVSNQILQALPSMQEAYNQNKDKYVRI